MLVINLTTIKSIDKLEQKLTDLSLPAYLVNKIKKDLSLHYDLGIQELEKLVNQNLVDVNPEVLAFLKNNTFKYIKDMNEDIGNKLRGILTRGLTSGQSNTQMSQQVSDLFKIAKNRARLIVRQETSRAFNVGGYQAALKLKAKGINVKKFYGIVDDNRTTAICKRLGSKYDINNPIPINQKFKDDVTGKSFLNPPDFHIGCRSGTIYVLA